MNLPNPLKPLKPLQFINIFIGIILPFIVIIFVLLSSLPVYSFNKTTKITPNKILQLNTKPGIPVRLNISKIKIDITLENVGLTKQGAVGIPKAPINAAWFNLSPHPGDIGNAIITGHYGQFKNGKSAIFNNLNKLKKGDELYIEDENGKNIIFVVRELKIYNANEQVPAIFKSDDNKSHLNIITCAGVWNEKTKTYSKRLVVFTDKK
jgi:LPXTG-site transpeptidase (sortase) family protein